MAIIEVGDKLVSTELFEQKFVCNLTACKGACCVEGDSGAPVTEEEVEKLEAIYPDVKPYLRTEGIEAIEMNGVAYKDFDGEWVTTLVNGKECAFATFDDNGTALCGIEQAYRDGKVDYKKPISCELYPIRTKKYQSFEAINYDRWDICSAACVHGEQLGVKVYRFLKDAIIRQYGEDFYQELEKIDQALENEA